ncbi:Asp23/Gls24 family envelope stress response protein [Staphylospora marina]|uniref:Asp23/Gls24 family envelope stress response protein n=1 Tax=Staphylospora marina TaxID=2490858 RepID=UPI000F5BF055|nr:Asp23/Gls24 family envelope stress response protein [Staphylospora marina]
MNELYHYESEVSGKVEIAPEVIQTIAGIAASNVEGVAAMSGGVEWLGRKNPKRGIRVELGERLSIELSVTVRYGYHIPDIGRKIQNEVKSAVESMTGLQVDEVTVRVEGIKFQQTEKGETEPSRVK